MGNHDLDLRRPRFRLLALTGVALALSTAVACGGMDDSSSSSGGDSGASAPASVAPMDGSGGTADSAITTDGDSAESASGTDGAVTNAPQFAVAAADRKQIFTAAIDVKVESLDKAVEEAAAAVGGLGGFAASEDVDLTGTSHATVVYRVPGPQFRAALTALSKIGKLRSQQIDSSDVTSQYADLESRVATMHTSIGRLQSFLAETTDVNQIASLESELTRREAEVESIEAQRRALADQVELSTITMSLDASTASPQTETDPDRPGFMGGLDTGWDVAVTIGAAVAATVGFLTPFLPLVAIALVIIVLVRRRRSRREDMGPGSGRGPGSGQGPWGGPPTSAPDPSPAPPAPEPGPDRDREPQPVG